MTCGLFWLKYGGEYFLNIFIVIEFEKTTYKRQSIYYKIYLNNIIWKLLQKRQKYLVSLERIT